MKAATGQPKDESIPGDRDAKISPSPYGNPSSTAESPFRWYHWALVVSIDMLGPFSTDSYIPNMATLQHDLHSSRVVVGYSLQVNWLVKGIATLLLGRLSDTHGRRPVLLISFLIYLAGTLGCAFSPTIPFFLLARVVQGVGEGSAAISSAIARDVLSDEMERMRMLALLGTLRPIAIITAPTVGGILGAYFGWRRVFLMLSCWGGLNLALTFTLLPETLKPRSLVGANSNHGSSNQDSDLASDVLRITKDPQSLALILSLTLLFSAPACMLSNIAFVLEGYGLSQVQASVLIGSIPCTMIVGSMLVGLLGGRKLTPVGAVGSLTMLRKGMVAVLCAAGVGMAIASAGEKRVDKHWLFSMVPFYFLVFSQSLCGPPGMAMYLSPWGSDAGLASGIMSLARASVPSLFAVLSTIVTARNGPSGLLLFISGLLIATNAVFWPLLGFRQEAECPLEEVEERGGISVNEPLNEDSAADDIPETRLLENYERENSIKK